MRIWRIWMLSSVVLLVVATGLVAEVIVIEADRLIDGTGVEPIENAALLIDGDRIMAVGAAADVPIPAGARVIDLQGYTILPRR